MKKRFFIIHICIYFINSIFMGYAVEVKQYGIAVFSFMMALLLFTFQGCMFHEEG